MKAVGIDPGTKSMDICKIEKQKTTYESTVPTQEVAKNPKKLIEELKKAEPFDVLAAPSGYGIEPTDLKEIPKNKLERWYYNYILLTEKQYIQEAKEKEVFGALLYYAMTETIKEIKKQQKNQKINYRVIFLPGVINLPTVPTYRKYNKLDMGTADKLAVTTLATHQQTKNKPNHQTSFLLIEMGYGYNAITAVKDGKIIDGIGGTTLQGPAFLTLGAMDAELTQLGGSWQKEDIFKGGLSTITGYKTPKQLLKNLNEPKTQKAYKAMMESIQKTVHSLKAITNTREILLSGRLTKKPKIREEIKKRLPNHNINKLSDLEGAEETKKTSQGYALLANGLKKGNFQDLIQHQKINEAKGTCIDYIKHPKKQKIKNKFTSFKNN